MVARRVQSRRRRRSGGARQGSHLCMYDEMKRKGKKWKGKERRGLTQRTLYEVRVLVAELGEEPPRLELFEFLPSPVHLPFGGSGRLVLGAQADWW